MAQPCESLSFELTPRADYHSTSHADVVSKSKRRSLRAKRNAIRQSILASVELRESLAGTNVSCSMCERVDSVALPAQRTSTGEEIGVMANSRFDSIEGELRTLRDEIVRGNVHIRVGNEDVRDIHEHLTTLEKKFDAFLQTFQQTCAYQLHTSSNQFHQQHLPVSCLQENTVLLSQQTYDFEDVGYWSDTAHDPVAEHGA